MSCGIHIEAKSGRKLRIGSSSVLRLCGWIGERKGDVDNLWRISQNGRSSRKFCLYVISHLLVSSRTLVTQFVHLERDVTDTFLQGRLWNRTLRSLCSTSGT